MSKPTRIYFERVFPVAQYINEKIGIELTLEPGQSLDEAYQEARNIVWENHKKNNPQLYVEEGKPVIKYKELNGNSYDGKGYVGNDELGQWAEPKKNAGTIEDQIKACKTEKELKEWRILSDSTPKLKPVYEKKLAELQKQSV